MDVTTSTNCLPIGQTQDLDSDLPTPVNMEASLSPLEPEAERGPGLGSEDPGLLKSPAANEQVTVTLNSDGGNEVWIKSKSFGEGKCEGGDLGAFYNDSSLGHGQVGGSGYRLNDPCGAGEGDLNYLLQTMGPSSDPEEAEDFPEAEDCPKTMVESEPDDDLPGPATAGMETEHREEETECGQREVTSVQRQGVEPGEMESRDPEVGPGNQEVEPGEQGVDPGDWEVESDEQGAGSGEQGTEPGGQGAEPVEEEMDCGEQEGEKEEEVSCQPHSDTACPGSPSTPEGVMLGDWKKPEEPNPSGEMRENARKEPHAGEEDGKGSGDCDPQSKESFVENLSTGPAEAEDTKTFTCGTNTAYDEVNIKPDKDALLKESMEVGKETPDPRRCSSSTKPSAKDSSTVTEERKEEEYISRRPRRATRLSFQAAEAQAQAQAAQTLSHRPQRHSRSLVKVTCANCRKPLQKGQTAYQRKGAPQLFCSSTCLTTYSQRPTSIKICTFCNKDIFNTKELVVAQAGSSQSFQEFCNTTCLSLYEAKLLKPTLSDESARCSVCNKKGKILHEVSNGNVVHRLCSNACFSKFRASNGLKTNCCDNCGVYFYNRGFMLQYLYHEGQQRRFCNTGCLNMYKKKNTKVLPCAWCKTMGKNFDMIANVDTTGKMGFFCSLCCITSYKVKQSGTIAPKSKCRYCKKSVLERVYYNMTDRIVHQFCSPNCWTNFQQSTPEGCIQLNCTYCHNIFTGKPEILDWQGSVRQFCCKVCCEDYKRLHGVVSICEYCRQEKILHEKIKFSGVEKNFCSEGCVLLYKQDFTKNLGLCCITCAYCSQTCQRAVTKELDGNTWDFCGEECKSKYLLWYFKVARCHACKRQGKLLETVHWRGEIKHFCNQQCLLRFYSQQNQPNLATQKGPESLLNKSSRMGAQRCDALVLRRCAPQSGRTPVRARESPCGELTVSVVPRDRSGDRRPDQAQESKNAASPTPMKFETKASKPPPPSPPSPPPPPPVTLKNKAVLCKPLTQNKGISCKPEMKSKGCQTEEEWKPRLIVVPIPVPVFIPVPLHMYCQNTPVPFSLPIPVPIPMFLPTTLESTEKIVETIEELKVKIPSNPFEADILAMAEMIAEAEEMEKASSDLCDLASNQSADGLLEDCDLFGSGRDDVLAMAVKMANVLDEPGQDLEADFPKNPLELNSGVDFLFDCGLVTTDEDQAEPEIPRAVRRGQKRIVLSESCSRDSLTSQQCCTGLNYSYGVNAWKSWVQAKYAGGETNKSEELRFGPKPMRIKEDILSCTAAELNYGLAQFVKEVQRPNGEHYEPDSVYYLCLGIQQYLLENNRMINIFTDLYYLTFVQELNKMLSGWQPSLLPNGLIFSRVEEEHLWECKQLGVYSPFVLLNTLMFFNTKYFGLRSVEEHVHLSFTSVMRQSRKCSTSRGSVKLVSIRYYLPAHCKKGRDQNSTLGKRKRGEAMAVMEQRENRMNPLRCPVKFYEFYLSKCPESMKSRSDVFYLQPERSCVAESPLWYSAIAMDHGMLESMLNRILAVKEIYQDHSAEALEEDEVEG